jgi:hypothetical protein
MKNGIQGKGLGEKHKTQKDKRSINQMDSGLLDFLEGERRFRLPKNKEGWDTGVVGERETTKRKNNRDLNNEEENKVSSSATSPALPHLSSSLPKLHFSFLLLIFFPIQSNTAGERERKKLEIMKNKIDCNPTVLF